jgi:hypothetical protein
MTHPLVMTHSLTAVTELLAFRATMSLAVSP